VLEQAELDEFEDADAVPVSENTFRKIAQTLRKVYLDPTVPKLVRRRILEAAVRSPQAWHAEAILTAYASHDPEWKLTAAFCMRYVRGFDRQILEALESADPKIHYEAVCAAGECELDAAAAPCRARHGSGYRQGPAARRHPGRVRHPPARNGGTAGGPG
jgi:hypothetical protein